MVITFGLNSRDNMHQIIPKFSGGLAILPINQTNYSRQRKFTKMGRQLARHALSHPLAHKRGSIMLATKKFIRGKAIKRSHLSWQLQIYPYKPPAYTHLFAQWSLIRTAESSWLSTLNRCRSLLVLFSIHAAHTDPWGLGRIGTPSTLEK